MIRQLSPYEKTHLQRFRKGDINIADYGEMPVEHITGKVEFGEQVFEVNQDVLIPRVESEELINLALEKIADRNNLIITDVGCGSGAIGISLFLKLKKKSVKAELYLSDVSAKALEVSKANVTNLIGESNQIHLLKSDLLKNYPPNVKFDLIIANLPYIPTERISVLDESVRKHEPHLALDGGEDGLKYIRKLVDQAQSKLSPSGIILLEVDHTHDRAFLIQNLKLEGFQLQVTRDQFQRTRFAILSTKK